MNLVPYIPGQGKKENFEFDVVAIRGYQLFAFSCTTEADSRGMLKHKLFEAFVRARQMGGDEACTALVCGVDQSTANGLAREVHSNMNLEGSSEMDPDERRIRVFGREELAELPGHITRWIRTQCKEK